MKQTILFICVCAALSACGIQRPLIRPSDIPEYERKRQEKLERREQDMREFEQQQIDEQQQLRQMMQDVMLRSKGAA